MTPFDPSVYYRIDQNPVIDTFLRFQIAPCKSEINVIQTGEIRKGIIFGHPVAIFLNAIVIIMYTPALVWIIAYFGTIPVMFKVEKSTVFISAPAFLRVGAWCLSC
jgi:hypothetical protein